MVVRIVSPVDSKSGDHGQLHAACREFEALFVSELLKPLEDAFSSAAGGIMGQLARQSVASQLAGAFGLGEMLYRQLVDEAQGLSEEQTA